MQVDTIAYLVASKGWTASEWLAVVASVASALSAFAAAYFGAYAKKKGENLATKEDFVAALSQLRASTEAVEGVKFSVAARAALAQELRGAAQKLTIAMASMLHSMCWLTWDAKTRGRLDPSLAAKYNDEAHRLIPEVSAQLALVSTYDLVLHNGLAPLADRLFWLDGSIGDAMVRCESEPEPGLERLTELHFEAAEFEQQHRKAVANILSRHFSQSSATPAT